LWYDAASNIWRCRCGALRRGTLLQHRHEADLGGAVQLDPIKPTLKGAGTKRLKVKYYKPLSNFPFKFNLRRYNSEHHPLDAYFLELVRQRRSARGADRADGRGLYSPTSQVNLSRFGHISRVFPCPIDWGIIIHPTYPTKRAYVEPKSGRV